VIVVDVLMYYLIMHSREKSREYEELIGVVHYQLIFDIHAFISPICGEYIERSIGSITSDIQMVPHACRVESKALPALEICEKCHI